MRIMFDKCTSSLFMSINFFQNVLRRVTEDSFHFVQLGTNTLQRATSIILLHYIVIFNLKKKNDESLPSNFERNYSCFRLNET